MTYGFKDKHDESKSIRAKQIWWPHVEAYFGPSAAHVVRPGTTEEDKAGCDVVLEFSAASIRIDIKSRSIGCSKYWQNGPVLALETWSVIPGSNDRNPDGVIGWTLDKSKVTTHVLYVFDPQDCRSSFLFPFHGLRNTFEMHMASWMQQYYVSRQKSTYHSSECAFVPARLLMELVEGAQSRII